jgi:hypothetical protein
VGGAEELDVGACRQILVQRRGLGHVTDAPPELCPVLERVQPEHPDLALRRAQRSDEGFYEGGLSRAVGPHETEDSSLGHAEVHAP